jgi:putative flippase GtrA
MTFVNQFFKFGIVGVSNTLVSWLCYYLIVFIREDLYMLGSIIGTIVGIANSFFWNDKYVFKGCDKDWRSRLKRLGKTYISYGGTSLLSIFLLWLGVQIGVNKMIAPVVTLIITVPLNFLINKFWAFCK